MKNDNPQQPYQQYEPPQGGQPYYPQQPPSRHKKSHKVRNTFLGILGGIVVLIVIAVAAGGGGSTGSSTTAADSHPTTFAPASPAQSASSPSTPPTPSAPAMTTAEQQAVEGAQGYLSMGSGFSYNSLLQQLTSSVGDGDTTADAKFAINYLHPDWDAQAVEAAKGYLQMGGFSRESLIQQLTSSYGDGFTEAQATYAADKVGLG